MNDNCSIDFPEQDPTNETRSLLQRLRAIGKQEAPATLLTTLRTRIEQEKLAAEGFHVSSQIKSEQTLQLPPERQETNRDPASARKRKSTGVLMPVRESPTERQQEENIGEVKQVKDAQRETSEPELLKISLGQCIGNYRLTEFLGRGAFANIYLGEHRYLKTYAAVKISRRQLIGEQEERFLKEAQIAAQLVHPQILRVLEYGVERGISYLVMDYAEHRSLREYHPIGGRLQHEEILGYAHDIAEALEYIHRQGYIHQDLKPDNLLFGRNGQLMVSDFGIAIAVQDTWGRQDQEGMGTLPYMAPEQIMGRPCIASDQYALGVIVYEWLCGELPFGEDPSHLVSLHLNAQPPSLRKQVPDLPVAVEQVVLRALEKDPRKRFSSISKFVEQLTLAWDGVLPLKEPLSFYSPTTHHTNISKKFLEQITRKRETNLKKAQSFLKTITLIILAIAIISASIIALIRAQNSRSVIPTPISHSSITLNSGEHITIGMNDGSKKFSFTTQDELDFNNLQNDQAANGEQCIYNQNALLGSQNYVTIAAVVTLSSTKSDKSASFEVGNNTLQGLCQKQILYNSTHKVKVRIVVANIGTEDPSVLQLTMPMVTQKLIQFARQDSTFIGVAGFSFSASLHDYDPADHIEIDSMNQLKAAGIPVISTTASSSDPIFTYQWAGYFYRVNPGNDAEGQVAAYYAHQQGKTTAFVFYDSHSPYSANLESAFANAFVNNFQGTVTLADAHSDDFNKYLPALNQNPSDLIFCACFASGTTPDFSVLYNDLQAYPALHNVMLIAGDALYDLANPVYRNVFFTAFAFPDSIFDLCNASAQCTSEQIAFYATYCQTFAPKVYNQNPVDYRANCQGYGSSRPSADTMLAYDALSTLLWAYDHRLSASTSLLNNVRQELPNVSFQGITGRIQLSSQSSDPVHKTLFIVFLEKNGNGNIIDYCGKFTSTVSGHLLPQQDC